MSADSRDLAQALRELHLGSGQIEGVVDLEGQPRFALRRVDDDLILEADAFPAMLYSDGKVHEIRDVLPPIPVTVDGRSGEIRRTRLTSWAPPPDARLAAVLGRSEQSVPAAGSSAGVSKELVIAPDLTTREWRAALDDHSLAGSGLEVDGCRFSGCCSWRRAVHAHHQ